MKADSLRSGSRHARRVHGELARVGAYLEDQVVMVTGAGGSIGKELCRQIGLVARSVGDAQEQPADHRRRGLQVARPRLATLDLKAVGVVAERQHGILGSCARIREHEFDQAFRIGHGRSDVGDRSAFVDEP